MVFSRALTPFDFNVAAGTCCGYPTICTSTLAMADWQHLSHGGHSFLFRVVVGGREAVLKIFRFAPLPHTHAPLAPGFPLTVSPYLYFHREAASYTALATGCADAEIVPMPRLRALLRLSSEHEKLLMDSRRLKGFIPNVFRQYFRAVPEEMPLVAVLMEYIPGRRLTRMDVRSEERRREAEEALAWIHDHGVVHADINWRNILLMRDGTESEGNDCEDSGGDGQEARCEETHEDWVYERGRIVFVDFSNAIPKAFVDSDDAWIDKVGIERARLKRLLDVGRPRGSR